MDQATIRRRLQRLRTIREVSQAELAGAMGFNDRQSLSDIELGKRAISPEEVACAAQYFGVNANYFTDPLELAGEAVFSWRKTAGSENNLQEFETRAGRWIGLYRYLSRIRGDSVHSALRRVDINPRSSFEQASEEGDAVSHALGLGDIPAIKLPNALEDQLDTLVLFVNTLPGISGAACQIGPLNTILINRNEVEGRRSFDLGHELFHLMTWDHMPPQHVEVSGELSKRYERIEKLADHFSAALLMPRFSLQSYIEGLPLPKDENSLAPWIRQAASAFHVSGQAMKWRLVGLGYLKRTVASRLDDTFLRIDSREDRPAPTRFSRRFVELLGWGIDEGHLSVRRAAQVVGTTVDDLANLFAEHGLKTPFDL